MDWQAGLGCEGWRSDQQVSMLCWRYSLTACPGMSARAATVSGSDDNDEGACLVLGPEWSLLILKDCGLGPPLDHPLQAVVSTLRPTERTVRHCDREHLRNHRVSFHRKPNRRVLFLVSSRQQQRLCSEARIWGFIVHPPLTRLSSFVLKCLLYFSGLASSTSHRGDSAGNPAPLASTGNS